MEPLPHTLPLSPGRCPVFSPSVPSTTEHPPLQGKDKQAEEERQELARKLEAEKEAALEAKERYRPLPVGPAPASLVSTDYGMAVGLPPDSSLKGYPTVVSCRPEGGSDGGSCPEVHSPWRRAHPPGFRTWLGTGCRCLVGDGDAGGAGGSTLWVHVPCVEIQCSYYWRGLPVLAEQKSPAHRPLF